MAARQENNATSKRKSAQGVCKKELHVLSRRPKIHRYLMTQQIGDVPRAVAPCQRKRRVEHLLARHKL